MKYIFLLLSLCVSLEGTSQDVPKQVYDKKATEKQLEDLAKNMIKDLFEKEILNTRGETNSQYAHIKEQAIAIQEAWKSVKKVKDLKIFSIAADFIKGKGITFNLGDYTSGEDYSDRLNTLYQSRGNFVARLADIYKLLVIFDSKAPLPASYEALAERKQESDRARAAFLESADKKKMQAAMAFKQMGEEYALKAKELSEMLLTKDHFVMSDAERLTVSKIAEDYLLSSYELKLKSDKLIKSLMKDPNSLQNQAHRTYSNELKARSFY